MAGVCIHGNVGCVNVRPGWQGCIYMVMLGAYMTGQDGRGVHCIHGNSHIF